ncbi:DUF72 domain-containing protein [Desulfosediminicola sp.]|uniref:DUF72 domain-containing protein n=1 Tax=Desulfosediminicola sp. TaxID=2886825 RepID=UPI003AF289F7
MADRQDIHAIPGALTLAGDCRVLFGTCGYSYTEWVDSTFYPAGTRTSEMLSFYGYTFSTVELNYTWYQMARAEAVARMVSKAPSHFRFSAKLTRTMTHELADDWREQLKLYREGIAPLGQQLQAVLVQLPPDFDRTLSNRRYLAELLDGLHGLPLAVEFRHASWAVDSVFQELERRKVSLVTVDEPEIAGLFPTLDVVTNPELFYVRFHGRNISGWRSGNMQKKFDYDYSEDELRGWSEEWLGKLVRQAKSGVIYFNNHVRGQAPRNAQRLKKIVGHSSLA